MSITKAPIKKMMNYLRPEINTLDDLAEWCAMSRGSYRITLLGISRNLQTSQITLITISISVNLMMQNTLNTTL
jgi:hypothetical protein